MQIKLNKLRSRIQPVLTFGVLISLFAGCQARTSNEVLTSFNSSKIQVKSNESSPSDTRFGPEWARGIIWYQIFPERFANANPQNDPVQPMSSLARWNHPFDEPTIEEIERQWFLHQGQPGLFRFHPNASGGVIANVITQRRYGGDLQGVLQHMDDLVGLGVDGIYLCPIFTSTSLHKYDAADHRHIDPTLAHPGTIGAESDPDLGDPSDETTWGWTPADRWFIDVFLPEARKRGLRVMLDGVWNHVGVDHWAFKDVRQNGEASAYSDWFDVRFDENGKLIWWKSWNSESGRLPVFLQTETGDLAPGPKEHMMAVTRRWMDPNGDGDPSDGIDGWRLDVANEIGRPFWKEWRSLVKDINPEALIVGEIWHDAKNYFDGTAFDAQMNYPAAYPVADWLSIGHMKDDTSSLAPRLSNVYSHDPRTDACQLNLMASHDTERLVSLMYNSRQRSFDNGAHPWQSVDTYDRYSVSDEALVRSLVAYMVMIANPGSLMIYNGDDFAMTGADDPDDRRPIPEALWDQSTLSPKTDWFRSKLIQILKIPKHSEYQTFLTNGQARWESTPDKRGIRIIRSAGDRSLMIDIGPSDTHWTPINGSPLSQASNIPLTLGETDWNIRIQIVEH
jgi:cyclomaltodextrinase / maltogenic alpha-amylase / neopullulanase